MFQGSNNKKETKKNNSGEDDLTYGPRDYDIGKSSSIKLYLLFLRENSTNSCDGQDQGRNFGHGLLLSVWNIRSSLEVYAIANAR